MQSQTTETTEDATIQLAAIEQRYEQAKQRIADVAVPTRTLGPEHDTVAVDVRLTQALIPLPAAPAADSRPQGRRFWRSLRLPRWVERSLLAS
jgi:hypothetical protein